MCLSFFHFIGILLTLLPNWSLANSRDTGHCVSGLYLGSTDIALQCVENSGL